MKILSCTSGTLEIEFDEPKHLDRVVEIQGELLVNGFLAISNLIEQTKPFAKELLWNEQRELSALISEWSRLNPNVYIFKRDEYIDNFRISFSEV